MKKIHDIDAFRIQLRLYGMLATMVVLIVIFLTRLGDDQERGREQLREWIDKMTALLAEAGSMNPQCYFAKEAGINLVVLGDTAWARDNLKTAIHFAHKNRIGKMGFFNTRIPPELKRLVNANFVESRLQTLIEF